MKTYLWLDDVRDPNSSVWKYEYFPESDREKINVIWLKEYPELVDYINQFGLPYKIFFDHDLGDDELGTGYDAAKWLVNYCIDNGDLKLPEWGVQSANPVGILNINSILRNYQKHLTK